jgi:2-keto-4-pentenoate hydratase
MTDLAQRLWHARLNGTVLDAETITPPATMEEAYAVQAGIAALAGDRIVGFKIGSTSAEAQRLLGTDQPGAGPLLARYVHASPARIAIAPAQMPAVEAEFAYRLGRDLPARADPYKKAEVAAAVAALAPAIEVVGSRFAGGLAGKGRYRITADGGANIAFAAGRWTTDRPARDVREHAVVMRIDGREHGRGTGARVLGDPLEALVWVAERMRTTGRGLKAGEIVSTGTCTGVDRVEPGQRAVADFGDLGTVEIDFVPFEA